MTFFVPTFEWLNTKKIKPTISPFNALRRRRKKRGLSLHSKKNRGDLWRGTKAKKKAKKKNRGDL